MQEPRFIHLKLYFLNFSHFSSFFTQYWASKYDVCDNFTNDFDALVAYLYLFYFMSLYSRMLLHSVKCIYVK